MELIILSLFQKMEWHLHGAKVRRGDLEMADLIANTNLSWLISMIQSWMFKQVVITPLSSRKIVNSTHVVKAQKVKSDLVSAMLSSTQ